MYRILVVDDDDTIRTVLASALEAEGFEVIPLAHGLRCLETAAKDQPDLVILDVQLLDASGVDICRQLKADNRTARIPVILFTGAAFDINIRVSGLDAGADDYLFKPISPKLLVSRIRSILKITTKPS